MLRMALCTCCFTCTGCMKLTKQTLNCICRLVYAIHYASNQHSLCITRLKPLAGWPSCTSAPQKACYRMLPYVYLCTTYVYSVTSGSASRNANATLPVITCVLAFSPLESLPSFRSHTPVQISSCHPQKAFSEAEFNVSNNTNVNSC